MKRDELSDEKKKEYDAICDKIMREIESQNPDQYRHSGQFDGKGTQIYRDTFEKHRSELEALFNWQALTNRRCFFGKYDAPLHRSTDERRHAVLQLTQQTDREWMTKCMIMG